MNTLKFALKQAKKYESGEKHLTDGSLIKPGAMLKCGSCGVSCSIADYSNMGLATMVTEQCHDCYRIPFKPPFKKHSIDMGSLHKEFDEEEPYNREMVIREFQKIVIEVLNYVDPKTDSIMEHDRISFIVWNYIWDGKLPSGNECHKKDFQFFLDEEFRDYVGVKGRLTKLEPLI